MRSAKERELWHNVRKYLREYNEVTGIHGLRYITEKRSRVEKFLWAVILLVSLGGCVYMIYEIVTKYVSSPVVVGFATKETPIYEIPFPAVTVCPASKCSWNKFNYTDVFTKHIVKNETVTDEEIQKLYTMTLLCSMGIDELELEGPNTVDEYFFDFINELKPEIVMYCLFMEQVFNCSESVTPIVTPQGICYTFNLMDRSDMFRDHVVHYSDFHKVGKDCHEYDSETGYVRGAGIDTYPMRSLMSGNQNALTLFLSYNPENADYICSEFLRGFNVYIHTPMDAPVLSKNYFSVSPYHAVSAVIEPKLTVTSSEIKKYSPEKRQCYLKDERPLKHFKTYTQSNCKLECLTNLTLKKCGCVAFYMPRNNKTAICGSGSVSCMDKVRTALVFNEVSSKISGENKLSCDCKPSCAELRYNVEAVATDVMVKEFFNLMRATNKQSEVMLDMSSMALSLVTVFFKEDQFMNLERNELYGLSDLISNIGGILGLFTGFSLITMIEIVYFITLRIYYNNKLYGMWSGPPN